MKDGQGCKFSNQPGESAGEASKRISKEKDDQIAALTAENHRLEAENEALRQSIQRSGQGESHNQGSNTLQDPDGSAKGKGKMRADDKSASSRLLWQKPEGFPSDDAPCHNQAHRALQAQVGELRHAIDAKDRELGIARGEICYLKPYKKNVDTLKTADQFVGQEMLWQLQTTPSMSYNWGLPSNISISHADPARAPRRYEFPYKPEMPGYLQIPSNVYLKSRLWKALESNDKDAITKYDSVYTKPFHTAQLSEDRFKDSNGVDINISRWTRVRFNNKLCIELLKAYFMYEHVEYPFVHKDLFLEDLREGREQFSSKVLVNAVLAAACVS